MKWLNDKPDSVGGRMSITFKERLRKNEEIAYAITFSKAFKNYVISSKMTNIRFGVDVIDDAVVMAIQLNKDGYGPRMTTPNNTVRTWFDITDYIEQFKEQGAEIQFNQEYELSAVRKNNVMLLSLVEEDAKEVAPQH